MRTIPILTLTILLCLSTVLMCTVLAQTTSITTAHTEPNVATNTTASVTTKINASATTTTSPSNTTTTKPNVTTITRYSLITITATETYVPPLAKSATMISIGFAAGALVGSAATYQWLSRSKGEKLGKKVKKQRR